jgi:hypothetical protein
MINLSQLPACVEDARRAWLDTDAGPGEPTDYADLMTRLAASRDKLPPLYRSAAADPFVGALKDLGVMKFKQILQRDPKRESTTGLMLDIAQAILQNGEGYQPKATDAFQEVISDLYDGFLSAEDRHGVKKPDYEVIAPLVKWGNPDSGPYTWPIDATKSFGLKVGIVNLPPANARHGLFAWAALAHETGGHDILHADKGLLRELAKRVEAALVANKLGAALADYWSSRAWSNAIVKEVDKDVAKIVLAGKAVPLAQAKKSAAVVAKTIAGEPLDALDGHAFAEIQNWRDSDDALVAALKPSLLRTTALPERYAGGFYAAHAVAAGVMAALEKSAAIPSIFDRMLGVLEVMHDANPSWGPLYVAHPGDIARDYVIGPRSAKKRR